MVTIRPLSVEDFLAVAALTQMQQIVLDYSTENLQPNVERRREPMRLCILISGAGRSLANLHEEIEAGRLDAQIVLVISSRHSVRGLEIAKERGIPSCVVARESYKSVSTFSRALWKRIRAVNPDLVCMAGFLSLIEIPDAYLGRVLNIHPALLPKFGGKGMYGLHVHEAVIAAGETKSGCTVHIADQEYDHGPPLVQLECPVHVDDTPRSLAERVFAQERIAYPEAIRKQAKEMSERGRMAVQPLFRRTASSG